MEKMIRPLQRALAANSSAAAFTAKVPTATKPSNDGVLDIAREGGLEAVEWMKLWALGLGNDNDAFSVRVWGWHKLPARTSAARDLWIPSVIAELAVVVSAANPGVAGTPLLATELLADTYTITTEGTITQATTRFGTIVTYSPTADVIGFALLPLQGFELIEFDFKRTTGTPTMNALFSMY